MLTTAIGGDPLSPPQITKAPSTEASDLIQAIANLPDSALTPAQAIARDILVLYGIKIPMIGSLFSKAYESATDKVHFLNTYFNTTAALGTEQQQQTSVTNTQTFSSPTRNNIQQNKQQNSQNSNEQKSNEQININHLRSKLNHALDSVTFKQEHSPNTNAEQPQTIKQTDTDQSRLDISSLTNNTTINMDAFDFESMVQQIDSENTNGTTKILDAAEIARRSQTVVTFRGLAERIKSHISNNTSNRQSTIAEQALWLAFARSNAGPLFDQMLQHVTGHHCTTPFPNSLLGLIAMVSPIIPDNIIKPSQHLNDGFNFLRLQTLKNSRSTQGDVADTARNLLNLNSKGYNATQFLIEVIKLREEFSTNIMKLGLNKEEATAIASAFANTVTIDTLDSAASHIQQTMEAWRATGKDFQDNSLAENLHDYLSIGSNGKPISGANTTMHNNSQSYANATKSNKNNKNKNNSNNNSDRRTIDQKGRKIIYTNNNKNNNNNNNNSSNSNKSNNNNNNSNSTNNNNNNNNNNHNGQQREPYKLIGKITGINHGNISKSVLFLRLLRSLSVFTDDGLPNNTILEYSLKEAGIHNEGLTVKQFVETCNHRYPSSRYFERQCPKSFREALLAKYSIIPNDVHETLNNGTNDTNNCTIDSNLTQQNYKSVMSAATKSKSKSGSTLTASSKQNNTDDWSRVGTNQDAETLHMAASNNLLRSKLERQQTLLMEMHNRTQTLETAATQKDERINSFNQKLDGIQKHLDNISHRHDNSKTKQ